VREEELKEGEDYYLEDGYLVFTEADLTDMRLVG
jgi:hypothetical protein